LAQDNRSEGSATVNHQEQGRADEGTLFRKLVDIMARLRSEDGCPWDLEQTTHSLKPYLIEEAYEVLDSIEEGDQAKLAEELGDLLFQILFHAQICQEEGRFGIRDVLEKVADKMIRRHPHVFGTAEAADAREVLAHWEAIKHEENSAEPSRSILAGIPKQLPALLRAQRLQTKASRVGFDWARPEEVVGKIAEEVRELRESMVRGDVRGAKEEIGDLLFSMVNLARLLEVDPEGALQGANRKFVRRFQHIERVARKQGRPLEEMTLKEMDALWDQAKGHP